MLTAAPAHGGALEPEWEATTSGLRLEHPDPRSNGRDRRFLSAAFCQEP